MSDETTPSKYHFDESIDQLINEVRQRIKAGVETSEHIAPSRLYVLAHDGSSATEAESNHFDNCEMCSVARKKYAQLLVDHAEIFSSDNTNDGYLEEPLVPQQIRTAELRSAFQSDTGEWLGLGSTVLADLKLRSTSVDILDEITDLVAELSRDDSEATALARAIRKMMGTEAANPILEAAVGWTIKQAYSAGRMAFSRLYDQLGEIIEATKASSGSIWLIDRRANDIRFVVPFITYNLPTKNVEYEITDDHGIIANVAFNGSSKYVHDVNGSDLYERALDETVAEFALPLFISSIDGSGNGHAERRFIGVLDLQFRVRPPYQDMEEQCQFRESVEHMAKKLRPDLEVIETLRNINEHWCCYHPLVHSSSFRKPLEELCSRVSTAIDCDHTTMTVWSADWTNRKMHAYATKGYDYDHRGECELDIDDSETGWGLMQAMRGLDLHIVTDPQEMFTRSEKARLHGVRHAFIAPVSGRDLPEKHEDLLGCINIYFYGTPMPNEEREYEQVEEALPKLARFVGRLVHSYTKARRRYYEECRDVAFEHPVEGQRGVGAQLWALLELIDEIFGSNVSTSKNVVQSSIWAKTGHRLFCVKSDGLLRLRTPTKEELSVFPLSPGFFAPFESDPWGAIYYDLDNEAHKGFTTRLITDVSYEQMVGDLVPAVKRCKVRLAKGDGSVDKPSGRFTEYFGTETEFDRWFLGVSVLDQNKKNVIGVIRVVRPLQGRPFTKSDEELLMMLARGASHVLEEWQRECFSYFEEMSMRPQNTESTKAVLLEDSTQSSKPRQNARVKVLARAAKS